MPTDMAVLRSKPPSCATRKSSHQFSIKTDLSLQWQATKTMDIKCLIASNKKIWTR